MTDKNDKSEKGGDPVVNSPSNLEKAIGIIFAFLIFGLIAYTIVGNVTVGQEKIPLLYALIALMAGVVVSTIPGFLNVDYSGKGVTLRAAGGAAAFVLVFVSLQEMQSSTKSAEKKKDPPVTTSTIKTPKALSFKATSYCSMTNVYGLGVHTDVSYAQQLAVQNCVARGGIPNCCSGNVRVEQVQQ